MKSEMLTISGAVSAIAILLLLVTSAGCASKHSLQTRVLRQSDKLYVEYAAGDINQARRSLEKLNEFFQSPATDILEPSGHAGINYFNYARLYALERRVGSESGAEIALIKARYWNVRRNELSGSLTNLEEMRQFNAPEKITEVADRLDRAATGGKGPNYIQKIPNR